MNDEAKVGELFASSIARPVDLDGRQFKVDRERAISTILHAADSADRQRSRWRRARVWGGALAVAAGLAFAASSFRTLNSEKLHVAAADTLLLQDVYGKVERHEAGHVIPVVRRDDSISVTTSNELITGAASGARLRSSQGLDIQLLENGRLTLAGLARQSSMSVQLLAGSIRCQVPPLPAGEQFSVVTPTATVTVHGTAFSVLVSGIAEAVRTCVRVSDGHVVVKSSEGERVLGPGMTWGCAPPVPPVEVGPNAAAPPSSMAAPSGREPTRAPAVKPAGTLDAENQLFQTALAAERVGDMPAAEASLERLLSKYPASLLSADARIALARVRRKAQSSP